MPSCRTETQILTDANLASYKGELKTVLENLVISIGAAETWLRHIEEFDAALKILNWTMDWSDLCVKDEKGINRLPSWGY